MSVNERTHRLHPVNRLIRDLGKDEALRERLVSDRQSLYSDYGLGAQEIAGLEEGSISAQERVGVHPMYRMHWLMMSQPEAAGALSVKEYIDKARSGAGNG